MYYLYLDHVDHTIIEALETLEVATVKELCQHLSLSQPTLTRRIGRLKRDGVLLPGTYLVNRDKLGHYQMIWVWGVPGSELMNADDPTTAITELNEILEAYQLSDTRHTAGPLWMMRVVLDGRLDYMKWVNRQLLDTGMFVRVDVSPVHNVLKQRRHVTFNEGVRKRPET